MSVLDNVNLGFRRRLPMLLQTEAAECGLACIAMIASYLGHETDLAHLRRRYGLSLRGATLKDLIRIADGLGMTSRPLRIELSEIALLKRPCILHWDLNHFVVLKSVGSHAIVIHDPAVGVRRLPLSEVSKHMTGVALELTPGGDFAPCGSGAARPGQPPAGAPGGHQAIARACCSGWRWRSRCSRWSARCCCSGSSIRRW